MNAADDLRLPIGPRPNALRDGEIATYLDQSMVEKNHEIAVTFQFIVDRRLFGACFESLMPESYARLGAQGGVMICPFLSTKALLPEVEFPGDIDLLVVPYDAGDLLVHESIAIEVKVVRAKFGKQGKSPNEFGISQSRALLKHGFPYAAVAHLIVSDRSPECSWSPVLVGKIVDEAGTVEGLRPDRRDLMPARLVDRSFGRLTKNCDVPELGLIASHTSRNGMWYPAVRRAMPNPMVSSRTSRSIADYYEARPWRFLDTPKYPPRGHAPT